MKRLYFQIKQEPKSKNGINEEEKRSFQQQVIQTIKTFKKYAYRSPVIMEIDFFCNQNNSPAIHTLAKNYLDLLNIPLSNLTKRKRLLYKDDRLVKILIVNYHLNSDIESKISIKVDRLKSFFEDVKLAEKIIYNDFEGDKISHSSFDIDEVESENNNRFSDPFEKLEDLRKDKDSFIKIIGRDAYNVMEDFAKQDIQKDYLQIGNLKVFDLISLFSPFLNEQMPFDLFKEVEKIRKNHRNFIISPPLTLDLKHVPIKNGQTQIFKSNVKIILKKFKEQFPLLFPIRVPLGVIVLFVPPKTQSIDLDNLARYIIPFVNETIQHPASFANSKHSITRYQFIELPSFDSDSKNGYVRIIFDNPSLSSIWDKIDNVIDKWERNV